MNHTLRIILCILQSLDGGQTPLIESVLEGRHFSVVGFWGVCTIGVAHIIVDIGSQEYNMYFRTIRRRVDGPNRKCAQGHALFHSWIFGGWALWAWLVLLPKWAFRNTVCILEPSYRR